MFFGKCGGWRNGIGSGRANRFRAHTLVEVRARSFVFVPESALGWNPSALGRVERACFGRGRGPRSVAGDASGHRRNGRHRQQPATSAPNGRQMRHRGNRDMGDEPNAGA